MRFPLRLFVPAAALALAIAGCGGNQSSSTSSSNGSFDGAAFPPGVRAHDFTLTDQYGRGVSLSAYRGQVVALAFLSPDCRACVLVAQQVRGALDELESHPPAKPGVKTLLVSSKTAAPRARVGRLLRETSLTGRVEYLTGTAKQLRPVWRAYRVTAAEDAITVLLIDRKGFERVGFGLEQITPEGLVHDIRMLAAG